jgi:hypothetical protein
LYEKVCDGLVAEGGSGFAGGGCVRGHGGGFPVAVYERGEFSVGLPGFITLTDIDGIAYQDEPHQESGWLAWTKYL